MAGVDGIVSGLNTSQIIQSLMEAARGPIRAMQGKVDSLEARRAKFQELNTLVQALQTAVAAVDQASELEAFSATSSQPSSLGVRVTGAPIAGTHAVRVTALAQSTLLRSSSGYASPTTQLKAGTMTVTVGSTSTVVPLSDAAGTRTIQGIAAYVNENLDGVQAYVLNTGSGSTPYRLMLEGEETGAANAVSVSISQSGGGASLAFSSMRSAQDGTLIVDSTTVTTPTNSPANILPGITFDMLQTMSSNATVVIGRDTSGMAAKVQSVVDAYNALSAFVKSQTGTQDGAVLSGDATMRAVSRRLANVLSQGYGTGNLAGLNAIGIGTAQDGSLEFDSAEFNAVAGGSNYDDLVEMLSGASGLLTGMASELDVITDPVSGMMQPRLTSFEGQIEALQDRIVDQEARLEGYEATLRQQFSHLEVVLARYQSTGDFLAAQLASLNSND